MSYLTDYYKKQCVLLEERLQYLSSEIHTLQYNLSEADESGATIATMDVEEFEKWLRRNPGAAGRAKTVRQAGRERLGLPPDPPRGSPKPASSAEKAGEGIKNLDFSPKNIAKNIGHMAVGLPAFMGTEYAVNKGLESVGIKNRHARGVPAAAVGGAVADVVTPIVLGGGIPSLGAAGVLAGTGALYGLAAYGGLEVADLINNIEINKKTGKKVEDWTGEALYNYVPPIKMATNLIAGSSPFAGLGGKGTATGVPGGERARVLKNAREDPTFKVNSQGTIR